MRPWFCFCAGNSAFMNLKRTMEREMHYLVFGEEKEISHAPSKHTLEDSHLDLGEESFALYTFGGTYYKQSNL